MTRYPVRVSAPFGSSQIGRDRKNRYSGRPQLTPIRNVAGIAQSARQFRRMDTSARIQTLKATAEITRSQNSPVAAAFCVQAAINPSTDKPFRTIHGTRCHIGTAAPARARARYVQRSADITALW